jgi:ParB-like chromosome segregation protein Spo0J
MKTAMGNDFDRKFQREDWRELQCHQVAHLMPEMTPDEYDGLVASIAAVGLKTPILLYGGRIADGRHRLRACIEKDIAPWFSEYIGTEQELSDFVFATNLVRRNLSKEQKVAIAVQQRKAGETMERIAVRMGVAQSTVHSWLKDKIKTEDTGTRTDAAGRQRPIKYQKSSKPEKEENEGEKQERRKIEAEEALDSWQKEYSDLPKSDLVSILKTFSVGLLPAPKNKS